MMKRFYISGRQRSGPTMLRLILESNPAIKCFDESVGCELLVNESRHKVSEFLRKEGAVLLGFKIPRFAEQLTWPEFSDQDYGSVPSFYDNQKVIQMFRNFTGQEIASTNSQIERQAIGSVPLGGYVTVRMKVTLPCLHPGSYAFSVTTGYIDHGEEVMLADRIENAIAFDMASSKRVHVMMSFPTTFEVEA